MQYEIGKRLYYMPLRRFGTIVEARPGDPDGACRIRFVDGDEVLVGAGELDRVAVGRMTPGVPDGGQPAGGARTPPPPNPPPVYKDLTSIDAGGGGQVCRCEKDGQVFAKKTIKPGAGPYEEERFAKEVRFLSKLNHPNIVKVVFAELTRRPFYFVMPLYRRSLHDILGEVCRDPGRVRKLFRSVLDGVEFAHREGLIHRDLKPGNILHNNDDDVVVTDFGLGLQLDAESTRQTQTGDKFGTPFFWPPEQFQDAKRTDARSDVYSLGKLLYVMHTGPAGFGRFSLNDVPADVRVVVNRACNPEPDRRYQTVTEMRDAWLMATGETYTNSPSEEVGNILKLLNADPNHPPTGLADRLHDIVLGGVDTLDLLQEVFMKAPVPALDKIRSRWPDNFPHLLAAFTDFMAKSAWPFSYTDQIARRCFDLAAVVDDYDMVADLVVCAFEVGYRHDRNYVRGLVKKYFDQPMPPALAVAVAERLRRLKPGYLADARKDLAKHKLNAAVLRVIFPDEEML